MDELEGKVAVITGAGSGIGAGVARAFAAAGMSVAVVDVDAGRAELVAGDLAAGGARAEAYAVDVTDPAAMDRLADDVFAQLGGCHVLHNNAGVSPFGTSWEHSRDEWVHVVNINLMGVVWGSNAFAPRMIDQGSGGHIVNTASAAALRKHPVSSAYSTTKFGVLGFTECLRQELAPHGIGVSALCPAGVDTNLFETMNGTLATNHSDEKFGEVLGSFMTLDEPHITMISPDQVGALVLEGVRHNDEYIITHPGSGPAVHDRHAGIETAYAVQRERHPELP